MQRDGVPEPILRNEHSRAQTVELCGDERGGFRCTLGKDHMGTHECVGLRGPMRWLDDDRGRGA
jgi:hypothetical protein